MMIVKILMCLIIGYFFGNITVSYIVGKVNDIDIRNYGSGNAGATNVARVLGKKEAIITFFGDALKAVFAIWLIRLVLYPADDLGIVLELFTGIGVVIGHNYPFWLDGKGGKGIAATGGIMFALDWRLALVAFITFILIVVITKYVSVGSLTITFLLPVWLMINYIEQPQVYLLGWVFVVFAFFRHKENIKRLINGNENKIGQKTNKA